ncbi:hypothetical protein BD408DRAFT_401050 [Parasitella parasitica]|nr:hypothetical protein BD408DRAFT_401050 [Parasitella parasitica]
MSNSLITLADANCQIEKMIAQTREEIDFAFESHKETGFQYYEGDRDSAEEAFDKCHTFYVQMMQIFVHSLSPDAVKSLASWKQGIAVLQSELNRLPAVTNSMYN